MIRINATWLNYIELFKWQNPIPTNTERGSQNVKFWKAACKLIVNTSSRKIRCEHRAELQEKNYFSKRLGFEIKKNEKYFQISHVHSTKT